MLEIGELAPDLEGRFLDGTVQHLSDLRGKLVLVYFYPRDDTPGCTTEACGLRDNIGDLAESGAEVIGVSTDSWESHQKFQEKYKLTFALASDQDTSIAKAYGVSTKIAGVIPSLGRTSFLVGPDGRIVEVWPKVDASVHAQEVLEAVQRHAVKA
jgi:peroxiredoxin Q/BCP